MTSQLKLSPVQVAVLRWIGDGSPPGVMNGYAHRISAAALRSRGLIKISGRGRTWRAQITSAGRAILESGQLVRTADAPRTDAAPSAVDLTREVDPAQPGQPPAPPPRRPPVVVPTNLRGAHALVKATRSAAIGRKADADGRIFLARRPGVAHMSLSRGQLRRGLLILHGLTRGAIRRGWDVVAYGQRGDGGVAIQTREHRYTVEVHEMTETVPFTEQEIAAWRDAAWLPSERERRAGQIPPPQLKRVKLTGRLRLYLPNGYRGGRVNWTDGPRGTVEQKLPSILRALEWRAEADDVAAAERAVRIEQMRREKQAREERARRERIDNARVERLVSEATAWRKAADARAYLAELERQFANLEEGERERVAAWHAWALNRIDSSDPSRRTSLIVGIDDDRDARRDVDRPTLLPWT